MLDSPRHLEWSGPDGSMDVWDGRGSWRRGADSAVAGAD
jgi:hypothetical protein